MDEEVLPGTGLDAGVGAILMKSFTIWHRKSYIAGNGNRIQAALDEWHRGDPGPTEVQAAYKSFLRELGCLVPRLERVTMEAGIDSEITSQAGATAGGSGNRRPLRAERGERSLGLTVRCVIRQRRHPAGRGDGRGWNPQRGERLSPGFGVPR
ncbi:hypothetical protein ACNKHT_19435 [Shigella flexneri]